MRWKLEVLDIDGRGSGSGKEHLINTPRGVKERARERDRQRERERE